MSEQSDEDDKRSDTQDSFKDKIKRKLFQIYFELMKERSMQVLYASILIVIMTLQMIGYIYYEKVRFPFNDDLYSTISSVLDLARVYPAVESSQNKDTYLALFFVMIIFLNAYLAQVFFVDYSISIGKFYFYFPIRFLQTMSSLLIWVLVSPITEMMVSIFNCDGTNHAVMTTTQCWQAEHIIYCVLAVITIFELIVICLMIGVLYNESRSTVTDALGRLDTNMELYLLLYRVGLAMISVYGTDSVFHWILGVVHLLGSLAFVRMYFKYLPYYSHVVSIVYGSCMCSYLWVSFNLIISLMLESLDYTGQSIVIILGILIIIPLVKSLREKSIYKMLFEYRYDKIKEEHELDLYATKVIELMNEQGHSEVDEMVLLGFVNNHRNECNKPECPLSIKEEIYLPATDTYSSADRSDLKDPIVLRHLIATIYDAYAKNSNSTSMLHVIYSQYLFTYIGNVHMALLELNAAEKMETTLQQRFTIYRSKRFIESFLMGKYKKKNKDASKQIFENLDVTLVITFENLFGKLQRAIEKAASEHIEFWSHLDSLLPDMNTLHKIGLNIINYSKTTQDIWNRLSKINSHYHKALRNYGYYLSEIRNDEEEGREYIEKAKGLEVLGSIDEHMNDFDVMFADDTAIVVMSGNKESQGKITKTNTGITNLFKYNTLEVTGHDVNILMPPLIASKHQLFLDKFFKTGREKVINKESELFALPRSGFVMSISTIVKPVPSLKEDIQYIGLIRERHKEYDYIITNSQGKIDSASSWISGLLHLQPNFLKENEVYIQLFCPDLLDLISGADSSLCTKFDLLQGVYELTFIVPINFSNIVQNFAKNPHASSDAISISEDEAGIESATPGIIPTTPDKTREIDLMDVNEAAPTEDHKVKKKKRLPEIVRKLCYMIHGGSYSKDLAAAKNILKESIKYTEYEFRRTWKVEVFERSFGDGALKIKVFRVLRDKSQEDATEKSSERIYGVQRTPSRTRVAPERLEHLKSVGLDPASSCHLSRKSKNEDKKSGEESSDLSPRVEEVKKMEENTSLLLLEESKVLDISTDQKRTGEGEEAEMKVEESKQTESVMKLTEDQPEPLDISLTSISDPSKNLPSSVRDIGTPEEKRGAEDEAKEELEKQAVNASMMSDINASRMEERPLIVDVSNSGKHRDSIAEHNVRMRKESGKRLPEPSGWREKFLRKGSKIGMDEQENVIRNYLRQEEGKKEEKHEEEKKEKPPEPERKAEIVEDDVGSVASNTKSLLKHLKALRKAVYEQYSPQSVIQLQWVARLVFLTLLVITLVYFFIANGLYNNLENNIENVFSSKSRLENTVGLGASVRALILMNPAARNDSGALLGPGRTATDYQKDGYEEQGYASMTYQEWTYKNLEKFAVELKKAQNALSTSSFSFSKENIEQINPSRIKVYYKQDNQIAADFTVDCWSAIMGLVTHSFKVKDMTLSSIVPSDPSVEYVLANSFNSILEKIEGATLAILDESDLSAGSNRQILMILLIVASVAIFVSVAIIIRVVIRVKKNKEDILVLFTEIPSKSVKTQLNNCRRCFNNFREDDKSGQQEQALLVEEEEKKETKEEKEKEEDEEGEEDDEKKDEAVDLLMGERTHRGSRKSKKKFKPYSTNIFVLLVKFMFFIVIVEGYFILSYFKADAFLSQTLKLINELGSVTSRSNSNSFLYRILQEYMGTNGSATILEKTSEEYVLDKINTTIKSQEDFLKSHSDNIGSNDAEYNDFFDQLIYEDVCQLLFSDAALKADCDSFQVLQKGLHSCNVAFWDAIREFANDFSRIRSGITPSQIAAKFSDSRLVENERLQNRYFIKAYDELQNKLKDSLESKFQSESSFLLILFICYLLLLVVLYFFVWTMFVESTRHSLWVTKSMLSIIPVSTIQEVRSIKEFLIQTSQSLFIGLRSD